PSPVADAQTRHRRLAELMRRFLHAASAAEPVVLLVDDAHWIDPASDDVLRELAEGVRGTRTLVVANFRPEYRASWMGGSHYHQLPLAPLSQRASQALLSDLLGRDLSVGTLFDLIGERTGGNPFFIEEVVHSLATAGSLAGQPGAYRLSTPLETLTIPTTVQSLLAARVDRLGEHVKDVLQTAAVIGKQFDEPLLREVVGLDEHALGAALAALQEAEFVHEVQPYPRAEYAFRHPLTQEVAYHSPLDHTVEPQSGQSEVRCGARRDAGLFLDIPARAVLGSADADAGGASRPGCGPVRGRGGAARCRARPAGVRRLPRLPRPEHHLRVPPLPGAARLDGDLRGGLLAAGRGRLGARPAPAGVERLCPGGVREPGRRCTQRLSPARWCLGRDGPVVAHRPAHRERRDPPVGKPQPSARLRGDPAFLPAPAGGGYGCADVGRGRHLPVPGRVAGGLCGVAVRALPAQ